jgi:hypothetical protein
VVSEGPSRSKGIGSMSKDSSSFRRFTGEEELNCRLVDCAFIELRRGVLISSVFRISFPRRVTDWTSLCSLTMPFGLTFFAFEDSDDAFEDSGIGGSWKKNKRFTNQNY